MNAEIKQRILAGEPFRSKGFAKAFAICIVDPINDRPDVDSKRLNLIGPEMHRTGIVTLLPKRAVTQSTIDLRRFDEARGRVPFKVKISLTFNTVPGTSALAERCDGVDETIEFDIDALEDATIV